MKYFKFVKFLGAGIFLGLIAAAIIVLHGGRDPAPAPSAYRPVPTSPFNADKFRAVAVETDAVPWAARLKPGRKKSPAEELLKDLPPGTEAYEITTPRGDHALIYRAADGGVFVPNDTPATVRIYRKAPPFVAFEIRPAVVAFTDASRVGGGLAVGVARVGRVHVGPAATYDSGQTLSFGAAATYNLWRNADVGAYAGKKIAREGWRGGIMAAVAIR